MSKVKIARMHMRARDTSGRGRIFAGSHLHRFRAKVLFMFFSARKNAL